MKYSFRNDYNILGSKEVLDYVFAHQEEVFTGYGLDEHSLNAEKLILNKFNLPHGSVHFVSGGTQANMLVISYLLKPYEAVLCADSGHINVHETGSVEGSGHKIVTVKGVNGKLNFKNIKEILSNFSDEHKVKIKMVYVSESTEYGTIYSKKELEDIYKVCKENDLYFFIDGARLSSALASKEADFTYEDIAANCDVFYIGGTKIGCLSGEAIVFKEQTIAKDFRYHIKNKGAMLAKGFVLGLEFERLFTDDLYLDLGKKENELGSYLKEKLEELKIHFLIDSPTNQLFPILSNDIINELKKDYDFEEWEKVDNENTCIRFVTSIATKKNAIDELIKDIKTLVNK